MDGAATVAACEAALAALAASWLPDVWLPNVWLPDTSAAACPFDPATDAERPAISVGVPFNINVGFCPLASATTGTAGSTASAVLKVWPEALQLSLGAEEFGPDALTDCFCLPSVGDAMRLAFNVVPVNFEAGAAAAWNVKGFGTTGFCGKFGSWRLGKALTELPGEAAEAGTSAASTTSPCFDPLFAATGCTDDTCGAIGVVDAGVGTGVFNATKGEAEGVDADAVEATACSDERDASGGGAVPWLF